MGEKVVQGRFRAHRRKGSRACFPKIKESGSICVIGLPKPTRNSNFSLVRKTMTAAILPGMKINNLGGKKHEEAGKEAT